MSFSALTARNRVFDLVEPCAAHFASGYSRGELGFAVLAPMVTQNEAAAEMCSSGTDVTETAQAQAAGIAALVLSVRPELTSRDMQDVFRKSAFPTDVTRAGAPVQYATLPSGLMHSHWVGYGRLDAARAVAAAQEHTLLGPRVVHSTAPAANPALPVPYFDRAGAFGGFHVREIGQAKTRPWRSS